MPEFDFNSIPRNRTDDEIDALAARVREAYPPERIRRIRSRSEWTWNSKRSAVAYRDRISYAMPAAYSAQPRESDDDPSASDLQRETVRDLRMMLAAAAVDSEYYPGFPSGLEQITIPSMFGCVKELASDSDRIKPLINSPSDVYSLPPAEIREGTVAHEMLRRMAYKHQRCCGAGEQIRVYMTDIQGPFSCAAQMWGIQDFLCDLREYPDEAHHLLSLCTDAITAYFRAMYEVTEGTLIPIHCHPVIWVPEDCGVAVSDDFFAVVGAETVKEFSIPYLEKIGAAFGGVTAHTCGNMNHLAGVMNETKTLKALNFGNSETDLEKYAAECDPRITLIVHQSGLSAGGLPVLNDEQRLKLCARVQRKTGVKIFCTFPAGPSATPTPADKKAWPEAAAL